MNFDEWWNKEGLLYFGSGTEQDAREIWNAAQAAERESCANVCDDRDMRDNSDESLEALRCAAAIRSRGNK